MNKGAEFDTLSNRKPVKVVEQRRSMGKFGSLENELSTRILNPLEASDVLLSQAIKKAAAIIKL